MARELRISLTLALVAILIAIGLGCTADGNRTGLVANCSSPLGGATPAASVVDQYTQLGFPIARRFIYAPATDPTGLLCRPGQYIDKVSFVDSRLEIEGSVFDISNGGMVEAFLVDADAIARIDLLTKNGEMNVFRVKQIVLRLSNRLTPEQASEYERALRILGGG
jgi:hypothetical protein